MSSNRYNDLHTTYDFNALKLAKDAVRGVLAIDKYLGRLGQILFFPVLLFSIHRYIYKIRYNRRRLEKTLKWVFENVDNLEERRLVDAHLATERLYKTCDSAHNAVKAGYDNRYIPIIYRAIARLSNEVLMLKNAVYEAENTLYDLAYPKEKRDLTPEQIDLLRAEYKESGIDFSDWDDDDEVYQKNHQH